MALFSHEQIYSFSQPLNDKLTPARKTGRVPRVINGLAKPICLIVDEIGRHKLDAENTRFLFDEEAGEVTR